MFKFNEVEPSKALENATNLSAFSGRAVVCKVKRPFIVDKDNNRVMYEKDDTVVVRGFDGGVLIMPKEDVVKMSSETTVDYYSHWKDDDEQDISGFARLMQHSDDKKMSLADFKDTFEVNDKETAVLEGYLNTAKNNLSDYLKREEQLYKIADKGDTWEDVGNIITAFISGVGGMASLVTLLLKMSVKYWYVSALLGALTVILFIICAVCIYSLETDEHFFNPIAMLMNSSRNREYAKIEKEYESKRVSDTNALNALRREDSWYVGE